jgi:hypothetical protein
MLVSRSLVVLALTVPITCVAQNWEVGAAGGYGWYNNATISNGVTSVEAGFPPRGAIGAVFGNNMYEYVGGELRYLLRFGGPELRSGGLVSSMTGYTNVIAYDVLIHMKPRDEKLRPFVAGGAGVKVFTSTGLLPNNSLTADLAGLRRDTQVEPVISAGAGLKYRFTKHAQFRMDFRTYFSPLPDEIFRRRRGFSAIHGWVYDFVPMAGISYVF